MMLLHADVFRYRKTLSDIDVFLFFMLLQVPPRFPLLFLDKPRIIRKSDDAYGMLFYL
jgi:hypothetical protein